jgi:ADP-ribosylation factor GTPase-activating protein 2/3
LGASKAKPVDFAAAEKKAKEEEERIKQLGYDRERELEEERARKEAEALKAAELAKAKSAEISLSSRVGGTSGTASGTSKPANFPRLGFGAIPTAQNTAPAASPSPKFVLLILLRALLN